MEARHHVSHPVGVGRLMYVGDATDDARGGAESMRRGAVIVGWAALIYGLTGKRRPFRKTAIASGVAAILFSQGYFAA